MITLATWVVKDLAEKALAQYEQYRKEANDRQLQAEWELVERKNRVLRFFFLSRYKTREEVPQAISDGQYYYSDMRWLGDLFYADNISFCKRLIAMSDYADEVKLSANDCKILFTPMKNDEDI